MPSWRMSRYFLGRPASVTEARRFVTVFLGGWPIVPTAELIVSELSTNAIRHSASGRFGGRFAVSIQAEPDRVWLGVVDQGGPHVPAVMHDCAHLDEHDDESGRGLLLVSCLADSWGVSGDVAGRTVWALLKVTPTLAAPATAPVTAMLGVASCR
ncbi:ATP-binding protein [Sphaerimonospora thailandensis]|uniref:Histidine kinase/HSP90-like ATPase domain-containing protein n=1 Tax=Sphaerimonospora thailandensis TaxID=795644 RepID=A0A8J3RJ67_9ACTN|nr:ATP-binding protein [Sphaerimonospora thailandensis]GIH73303.1 hypothetical protein Mth01_55560 [Sphaerimonospora thailandensis]